jgi:P4 family phage/plasmid primase-like protien
MAAAAPDLPQRPVRKETQKMSNRSIHSNTIPNTNLDETKKNEARSWLAACNIPVLGGDGATESPDHGRHETIEGEPPEVDPQPTEEQIVSWLSALMAQDQVVELRALDVSTPDYAKPHTVSGYFDLEHRRDLAASALNLSESASGVYFTFNPVNPDLLARRMNRVAPMQKGDGATEADALCRRWLFIDVDSERPSGISATDEEKANSRETAELVRDHLRALDWPDPILADSGNGYHLLYRIDLPAAADADNLVKKVLRALAARFDTPTVKIDHQVGNRARLTKLYGTVARKGDETATRPYRSSRILEIPESITVVASELLEAVAAEAPAPQVVSDTAARQVLLPGSDESTVLNRARAYLAKIPGGVSGEYGHNRTFHVACVLVRDFCLTQEAALPLLREWNQKCEPPWTEKELDHKLDGAIKKEGPRGRLLAATNRPPDQPLAVPAHGCAPSSPVAQEGVPDLDDPHRLARWFLARHYQDGDGPRLRFWREEWWRWHRGAYSTLKDEDLRAQLWAALEPALNCPGESESKQEAEHASKGRTRSRKVTSHLITNVRGALTGLTLVDKDVEQPAWLAPDGTATSLPLLALQNGLLNVDRLLDGAESDLLQPLTPAWFSPICLPYEYNPSAPCPRWMAFLDRNLEGDAERIAMLQEWFGYCLTPDTSQQKFLLLEGEGCNGKSVACAVLAALLGEGNVTHVPLEAFQQRFALTQTVGKLANIASEVGEIDRVAEGLLKSFTSGDRMLFDRKGISPIEALPSARLVLATNNRPRFADRSGGVWRRMLLLPFRVEIQAQERVYGMDKSAWWLASGELPGIFNWAIAGLRRLREQKHFTQPKVCSEALEEYRTDCNPARVFLLEHCEADPASLVNCQVLYGHYSSWCNLSGYQRLGNRAFGLELRRQFPGVDRTRPGTRSKREYTYTGLKYTGPYYPPW